MLLRNRYVKRTFKYLLYLIYSSIFCILIIISTKKKNVISNELADFKPIIGTLLPQGWGFFTRNPQEARTYLFILNDGKWTVDPDQNNLSIYNLGLRRGGRSKMLQLSTVMNRIESKKWKVVVDNKLDSVMQLAFNNPTIIADSTLSVHLYNKYLIIQKQIVPWSWREYKTYGQNVRYTFLEIRK